MNNLVRLKAAGSMPDSESLTQMVTECLEDTKTDQPNALRVWDGKDKKSDIEKIALAILGINTDFNLL